MTQSQNGPGTFRLVETTIADIQAAYRSKFLSARKLVELYMKRIEAYDRSGPTINSIVTVNPRALEEAARLDDALGASGPVGPLHGVPVILKDQVDAIGTPTTLGSLLFKNYFPNRDAFIVEKLRAAGAIILAKATLGEFASGDAYGSGFGFTRNPYALDRTPGGSSGGSAASISANLGAVGIGQESYASVRRPAAWCALAGMRTSPGLVSRSGSYGGWPNTVGLLGPMTRSVADLALVLDALVGYDPEDPLTAFGVGHAPRTFTAFLDEGGLKGSRIGILRESMGRVSRPEAPDFMEIDRAFDRAVGELATSGAVVVDPIVIPKLNELLEQRSDGVNGEADASWDVYFSRGSNPPFKSRAEMLASPAYEKVRRGRSWSRGVTHAEYLAARQELMTNVLTVMADHKLDAIVHRTAEHHPQLISDGIDPLAEGYADGRGATHINTFLVDVPSISVPSGSAGGLPVGITFLGRPYDDGTVLKLAYAYERATRHRKPPTSTPPLPDEP